MKNMTRNIQNGFLDMKLGSRILRIMGVTKWAVFPEGGGQQFSGTVKGGGAQGKQRGGGQTLSYTAKKKLISPHIISHTGGGGRAPLR